MKLCIPISEDQGLQSPLCPHFGSAPLFAVCDPEQETISVVANANDHHQHGACRPLDTIAELGVDALVVGGMGRRAILALQQGGIKVYRSQAATVAQALEQLQQGELVELDPATACAGHGGH